MSPDRRAARGPRVGAAMCTSVWVIIGTHTGAHMRPKIQICLHIYTCIYLDACVYLCVCVIVCVRVRPSKYPCKPITYKGNYMLNHSQDSSPADQVTLRARQPRGGLKERKRRRRTAKDISYGRRSGQPIAVRVSVNRSVNWRSFWKPWKLGRVSG